MINRDGYGREDEMYEIISYVGVGEIRFGMKCDEVCGLLCEDYRRIDHVYTAVKNWDLR